MGEWKMVRLGDVVKIKTGKLDANASNLDGIYPFFTCSKEALKISSYTYDCECVLVAGNGDLNVKYYNGKFDAYQRTYIIESPEKINLFVPYLYLFLESYIETLRAESIGGVIKYIKLGNLTEAYIPLPPLDEQKKIATILDKASVLIALRKQQIEKMDVLVKSRFMEIFSDGKYPKVKLEKICEKITDGTHQPPKFITEGIPFLLVSNIVNNKIVYKTTKFISRPEYESLIKRTPIEIGDILLTIVGSYGNPAVVEKTKEFCFQRHIAYLKPKKTFVNSYYLKYAFLSPRVKQQIEQKVKGVAQKTLNLSELKTIFVPFPPLPLQEKFADFVNQAETQKSTFQKGLNMLELQYKALMQRYFER